jgi:NAD(P)H dehydrogenase (quinone)
MARHDGELQLGSFPVTVLILGATGNLGRLTAAAIHGQYPNVQLRLTSHREEGRKQLRDAYPDAEVVAADWYDEGSLRSAIAGVERILMVTPDFATDETIVTPNLIRAVKAAGGVKQVLRFIAIPPGFTAAALTPEQLATRCGAAQHVVAKPALDASGLPVTYVNAACWIMFNLPWFMSAAVKASRSLVMPSAADAARLWVSETDLADVFTKILTADAGLHVGKDYLVTSGRRYTFAQVAALLSEVLGQPVSYVDSDASLRNAMGDAFPVLMTYFTHETEAYSAVPTTCVIEELLGRAPVTLRQYAEMNKELFA